MGENPGQREVVGGKLPALAKREELGQLQSREAAETLHRRLEVPSNLSFPRLCSEPGGGGLQGPGNVHPHALRPTSFS